MSVEIQFAHPYKNHVAGDRAQVDESEAIGLVIDGIAVYATKPEAKKVGADPEQAASARK